MYSFTVKSKVFQTLTCIRQERPSEQYRNTVKDLLLPKTVSLQKDEKPHNAGLGDTAIPHIKIKITEIPLQKKLNTINPHVPLIKRLDQRRLLKSDPWLCLSQIALYALKHDMAV